MDAGPDTSSVGPTHLRPTHWPRPLRVLVAAGPTHEPIDQVRFIGNRSSGRMGQAIAAEFHSRGCSVALARGPGVTGVTGCNDHAFVTAADLLETLKRLWKEHDLLIMAAAVADFRPAASVAGKMRREAGPVTLLLEPTEDILAGLTSMRTPQQFVVGFALEEASQLAQSAQAKLQRKRADLIVANPLSTLDALSVEGCVYFPDGNRAAPPPGPIAKPAFAAWLAQLVLPLAGARTFGPH